MVEPVNNIAGSTITCTNAACDCELMIVHPCPHGSNYVCGCGHEMTAAHTDQRDPR